MPTVKMPTTYAEMMAMKQTASDARKPMYFYTDNDSQFEQLVGESSYAVTFPKGLLPPVKGFWSLTMYNPEHVFYPNALSATLSVRRTSR